MRERQKSGQPGQGGARVPARRTDPLRHRRPCCGQSDARSCDSLAVMDALARFRRCARPTPLKRPRWRFGEGSTEGTTKGTVREPSGDGRDEDVVLSLRREPPAASPPRPLRSPLQQTMTDLEVIVLDDGSTDQTRDVVVEFADPRIRHFSRPHRGVAAARNEALLYARASLIAFLDSDDEWVPDKLDRQLRHLAGTAQSAGIVYSGFTSVHEDTGRRYVYAPPAFGRGMVFAKLLETHWITFSTVVARREVFEAVGGFNEGLRTGSDREWLR